MDKRNRHYRGTLGLYTRRLQRKAENFNKVRPLSEPFVKMIGSKKEVSILDVGSGPFPVIGNYLEGVEIHITASDMLADEYNKIMKDAGIVPMFIPEYQDMENMTYPDNTFDIVHSHNAVDHTESVDKAFREMYRVCKPGGWIYIWCGINEGEWQHYRGLHTWNLEPSDGDCRAWTPSRSFMLSEILPDVRVHSRGKRHATYICQKALCTTPMAGATRKY